MGRRRALSACANLAEVRKLGVVVCDRVNLPDWSEVQLFGRSRRGRNGWQCRLLGFSMPARLNRLPALAADLVRRQAKVIVATGPAVFAAKAATTTIPIVFQTAANPVE